MNFIVTIYRRKRDVNSLTGWTSLPVQNFNASSLPEARTKMIKAQGLQFVWKAELSVILDTWYATGHLIN